MQRCRLRSTLILLGPAPFDYVWLSKKEVDEVHSRIWRRNDVPWDRLSLQSHLLRRRRHAPGKARLLEPRIVKQLLNKKKQPHGHVRTVLATKGSAVYDAGVIASQKLQ